MTHKYSQDCAEPVSEDVDSSIGIVDVGKHSCGVAFSSRSGCVPCPRDGVAVENDDEKRDNVHDNEHAGGHPKGDDEAFLTARNSNLHQRDTKLDWHNGNAVEDLEEEEPLITVSLLCSVCSD